MNGFQYREISPDRTFSGVSMTSRYIAASINLRGGRRSSSINMRVVERKCHEATMSYIIRLRKLVVRCLRHLLLFIRKKLPPSNIVACMHSLLSLALRPALPLSFQLYGVRFSGRSPRHPSGSHRNLGDSLHGTRVPILPDRQAKIARASITDVI